MRSAGYLEMIMTDPEQCTPSLGKLNYGSPRRTIRPFADSQNHKAPLARPWEIDPSNAPGHKILVCLAGRAHLDLDSTSVRHVGESVVRPREEARF